MFSDGWFSREFPTVQVIKLLQVMIATSDSPSRISVVGNPISHTHTHTHIFLSGKRGYIRDCINNLVCEFYCVIYIDCMFAEYYSSYKPGSDGVELKYIFFLQKFQLSLYFRFSL